MAQVCVNTMGVGDWDQIGVSLGLVGKRGRVVVTNIHPAASETKVAMSALELTTYEKQVRGSLFGSCNPRSDIPRMLELYRSRARTEDSDELRTRTYNLDEVYIGYDDMPQRPRPAGRDHLLDRPVGGAPRLPEPLGVERAASYV